MVISQRLKFEIKVHEQLLRMLISAENGRDCGVESQTGNKTFLVGISGQGRGGKLGEHLVRVFKRRGMFRSTFPWTGFSKICSAFFAFHDVSHYEVSD